jgi:DNA-binding MarR family transcriptional regulator
MAVLSVEDCVGDRSPGRMLRRINKLLMTRIEARFTDAELGFVEWMALKLVHDGVATNAGELARDIGINTGATTRLIDGLEANGLIERDRSCADRRVVRLRLTRAGTAKQREKIPLMVASWNELLAGFEQAEANRLIALLGKLLDAMEHAVGSRLADSVG